MPSKITKDNAMVFSGRLMTLRKNKKISQKQAAKDLGISQALLSHYENGVRECGLNFVVRAANYYNVSCDYLLGNSKSTVNFEERVEISDIEEDKEMTTDTIVRAAVVLGSRMKKDEELRKFITEVYGLSTYIILYAGIKKGILPMSWVGSNLLNPDVASYLANSVASITRDVKSASKKNTKEEAPMCVSTISSWTNDYLNLSIASLL